MEDLQRFDEKADRDYPCELQLTFNRKSVFDETVRNRGQCRHAPTRIRKGEDVVRIVGGEKVWRFHPECVYEHLRELEPQIGRLE